jgi:hypothetical protein
MSIDSHPLPLAETILEKMKRGVYYPGHHLGTREALDRLVLQGLLERMDGSFLCGPDSEPTYCLSEPKRSKPRPMQTHETHR